MPLDPSRAWGMAATDLAWCNGPQETGGVGGPSSRGMGCAAAWSPRRSGAATASGIEMGRYPLPLPRSRGVTAVGGVDAATAVGGVGDCFSNHGQEQRWYGVTHLETKARNIGILRRDARGGSGGGGEKRAK
jgi:hypothetical protein